MNTWKISGVLIVYCWPITIKFRIRKQTSKPQTNYHCCLQFSYLVPYWLISYNTITFHKYVWISRFCEFHSKFKHEEKIILTLSNLSEGLPELLLPLLLSLSLFFYYCKSSHLSLFLNPFKQCIHKSRWCLTWGNTSCHANSFHRAEFIPSHSWNMRTSGSLRSKVPWTYGGYQIRKKAVL